MIMVVVTVLLLIIISLTRVGRRQPDHIYDRHDSAETGQVNPSRETGRLRRLTDEPVAEIVQYGEPPPLAIRASFGWAGSAAVP